MKQGFTLIELLVVIAIMVVVFGLTIASFNSFNRHEQVQQAALNFKTDLRYAQTRAISVDKPSSCASTDAFVGMEVSFSADAKSYTIQHVCQSGVAGTAETVTLPGSVTFQTVPIGFTFHALTKSTDLAGDQTISLGNSGNIYRIQVTTNGEINDLGFL